MNTWQKQCSTILPHYNKLAPIQGSLLAPSGSQRILSSLKAVIYFITNASSWIRGIRKHEIGLWHRSFHLWNINQCPKDVGVSVRASQWWDALWAPPVDNPTVIPALIIPSEGMLSGCLQTCPKLIPAYPGFVSKGEAGLLLGACNSEPNLMKLPTPALKCENCNSGQSELCFPGFTTMHETN